MSATREPATFEALSDLRVESSTLIEGLPGHGLVASIAVDQVTKQLALEHFGNVYSESFPPVTTFEDGRVRDLVRVYAGTDPAVMTLQSDLPLPQESFAPLSGAIVDGLSAHFEEAIFLAGVSAESKQSHGEVFGIATTDDVERKLEAAGVDLMEGNGLVGGVTGALVSDCYHAEVPAAVLVVKSNPYLPDPGAARSVIENALEPLVDFDIDTTELEEQADEIQRRKSQIARQLQQQQQQKPQSPSMYQ
ncbi:MAG: proteasome assembly chaperone family protein [Haloferacaceae archaeon]